MIFVLFFLVEDKCAIKIQAWWRGYLARKSEIVQRKIFVLKSKKLMVNFKSLKEEYVIIIIFNLAEYWSSLIQPALIDYS